MIARHWTGRARFSTRLRRVLCDLWRAKLQGLDPISDLAGAANVLFSRQFLKSLLFTINTVQSILKNERSLTFKYINS